MHECQRNASGTATVEAKAGIVATWHRWANVDWWVASVFLVPQHAAEKEQAHAGTDDIRQPDAVRGEIARLRLVDAVHEQRVVTDKNRPEADEEGGDIVGVAETDSERSAQEHERQTTKAAGPASPRLSAAAVQAAVGLGQLSLLGLPGLFAQSVKVAGQERKARLDGQRLLHAD